MKRKLALSFVLVTWIASVLIFGAATAILPIAKAAESSYGNRNTNGNSNGDTDKETDKSPSEADAEKKATPNNPDPDKDNDNDLPPPPSGNNPPNYNGPPGGIIPHPPPIFPPLSPKGPFPEPPPFIIHPPPIHCPSGFHLNHGKCERNIVININRNVHTSSSSGSHTLSNICFDEIKLAWIGKIQRGDNSEVDKIIDDCLDV